MSTRDTASELNCVDGDLPFIFHFDVRAPVAQFVRASDGHSQDLVSKILAGSHVLFLFTISIHEYVLSHNQELSYTVSYINVLYLTQ